MAVLKTRSVPTVERTLAILELLAQCRAGLTLPELARQLPAPKSSVHCLLLTLERHGYVHRREKTSRFTLSFKLFGMVNFTMSGLELREQSRAFLRTLVERTQLTAHMAILERNEAVLVEKVEAPGVSRMATWLGKRMDLHCTALGKAFLAYWPEEELDRLVRERPLLRHNDNTIVSVRKLKAEMARIRQTGYAVDDEEEEIGARCIGAPVFDGTGKPIASISITGTVAQITAENLPALAEEVRRAALGIFEALKSYPGRETR